MSSRLYQLSYSTLPRPPWPGAGELERKSSPPRGIQNLRQLFSEEPAAKQELHRHLSAVRMFPLEDGEGWYYVDEGTWDLLGTDPLAPDMRVREEGRIRMVAGVDLNQRPLGYEPTQIIAIGKDFRYSANV